MKYSNRPKWTEVFNFAADPYEIKNLASGTALPASLEADLQTLIRAVNCTASSSGLRLRVRTKPINSL